MAAWEMDDDRTTDLATGSSPMVPDLPPFGTPSGASERLSGDAVPCPGRRSSPAHASSDGGEKRRSRDVTTDESISILDPRRFTPTLHANLVSEILALRRDQAEKATQIESLETTLHAARQERDRLQDSLRSTAKEGRSLKRQLSLLEGGTASALGEFARERDEAVDFVAETKRRLEAAQKKMRCQEDESRRLHDLWALEKGGWEDERRRFERKIHVAESRLKTVLDEVAVYQAVREHRAGTQSGTASARESEGEEALHGLDARSVRTVSRTSSVRRSHRHGVGHAFGPDGRSLADELEFDDDETDLDGRESAPSNHASPGRRRRGDGRDGVSSSIHHRMPSVEGLKRPGSVVHGRPFAAEPLMAPLDSDEDEEREPEATVVGSIDAQPTSPAPEAAAAKPATAELATRTRMPELDGPAGGDSEIEANQRRKRVQVRRPVLILASPKADIRMVSAASQTMEPPLSPPKTPESSCMGSESPPGTPGVLMVSCSMQTEEPAVVGGEPEEASLAAQPSPPLPIPSISIQPPTSRPTTPQAPRLPQHFQDFGCQVNLPTSDSVVDASVQTEGIQVDKRLALLPPHLRPSTISSRPTSPNRTTSSERDADFTPVPGNPPARNPRRLKGGRAPRAMPPSPPLDGDDDEPRDDSTLSSRRGAPTRPSHHFTSIFAGFDTASSDEADDFDGYQSDSEYRTALSAPRPRWISSRQKQGPFGAGTKVPGPNSQPWAGGVAKAAGETTRDETEPLSKGHDGKLSRTYEKSPPPPPPALGRAGVIRRAAVIQCGIAIRQGRTRSPSLPDPSRPPFPIPTRASSRVPGVGAGTPSDGQQSPTRRDGWPRRGSSRSSYQGHNVRKVRSAMALPQERRDRARVSSSPPPLSPSTEAPASPGLPPLPLNDITTPRTRDGDSSRRRGHRHEPSTNTDMTYNTEPTSLTSGSQSPGVVDAIAQTMVGEWMLKYVRRRRSFGVPEAAGKDDSSNDRHKRWVWLAPYERAILWSGKQPLSGSALMGKTGRKRKRPTPRSSWWMEMLTCAVTIQSVLDVKDDNAAPKIMPHVFNRSILILTPQRALKFTARSPERHYLWLTALSFLAHSSHAVPDVLAGPPAWRRANGQRAHPDFETSRAKLKRGGIRDSIRLAKGRSDGSKDAPVGSSSIPSVPSSRMGDAAHLRLAGGRSREQLREAAEPPIIPRFTERTVQATEHGRKRSNTGGLVAPPLSFRGFSGPAAGGGAHHHLSVGMASGRGGTAGSTETHQPRASGNTEWGVSRKASQRTLAASSSPAGNFFDAVGTVRMEAFIGPLAFSPTCDHADELDEVRQSTRRRSKELRRRSSRSIREECLGRSRTVEDDFFNDDPFKGF
ncbi:putative nuclear migration protein ami1 [Drechmeria coniospora]|uniref:Putative nuclear migration protein ami1 n=1 Tax=Drechmeria coniospora TaxID=98403 RepID=A0A151GTN1_DRECN|nr:putative nuclear migration protein ami1 [Drechmeria coniospora]KYK60428.1 putative nuclear migration protein ami1 [Drechmeria coniospora]